MKIVLILLKILNNRKNLKKMTLKDLITNIDLNNNEIIITKTDLKPFDNEVVTGKSAVLTIKERGGKITWKMKKNFCCVFQRRQLRI